MATEHTPNPRFRDSLLICEVVKQTNGEPGRAVAQKMMSQYQQGMKWAAVISHDQPLNVMTPTYMRVNDAGYSGQGYGENRMFECLDGSTFMYEDTGGYHRHPTGRSISRHTGPQGQAQGQNQTVPTPQPQGK